jgi:hypothetical protein
LILILLAAITGGAPLHRLVAQPADTTAVGQPMPDTTHKPGWVKRVASNAFNNYFNDTSDPEKPKFLVYPTLAYAPETSWELGLSSLMLYYARRDTTNRLSEVSALMFATLNQQYGAWFDHFLYGHQDKWFFLGRMRFQRFPLLYYGIGPASLEEDKAIVDADYVLIKERILRRIRPNFFAGLEIDFQQISNTSMEAGNGSLPKPLGADGSRNIGLGAGLVYDSRHNALNVRKGVFAELAYLNYSPNLGSTYAFQNLSMDMRVYLPVRRNQVWATQVYGQFLQGDVPFNQMALLGGESLMRGYYTGRFRDKNYLAAQTEYRFLPFSFSKRWGAAVFASAGTVAPTVNALSFKYIKPAAGGGIRYLIFPKKDIFLRGDFGITPEGINFYLYTGEAF